jgi:myo-inositol catabolism protein IolC
MANPNPAEPHALADALALPPDTAPDADWWRWMAVAARVLSECYAFICRDNNFQRDVRIIGEAATKAYLETNPYATAQDVRRDARIIAAEIATKAYLKTNPYATARDVRIIGEAAAKAYKDYPETNPAATARSSPDMVNQHALAIRCRDELAVLILPLYHAANRLLPDLVAAGRFEAVRGFVAAATNPEAAAEAWATMANHATVELMKPTPKDAATVAAGQEQDTGPVPPVDWQWPGLPMNLEHLAKALIANEGREMSAYDLAKKLPGEPSRLVNDHRKRWGEWIEKHIGHKHGIYWWKAKLTPAK